MIRSATIPDSEPISKALWSIWHQFKIQQIPSPIRSYASADALAEEIRCDLSHWLVCESANSQPPGFFLLCPVADDKTKKRQRFPEHSARIQHFCCLLSGEAILSHLQLLLSHLPEQSILLVIPASLRDAYWAATKAGFRQLGDCPTMVGTFVWLYLDREGKHGEIQAKLRKDRIVA